MVYNNFTQFISLHNHSTFSDGVSSLDEIVQEAENCGLKYIGISDHICLHYHIRDKLKGSRIGEYVRAVREVAKNHKTVVLLGAELDAPLSAKEATQCAQIKKQYDFDYFIGSVHPFESLRDRRRIKKRFDRDLESFLLDQKNYWNQLYLLSQMPIIDILGHLDYYKVCGVRTDQYFTKEIAELLDSIKAHGKMVEVNTSGYKEPLLKKTMPSEGILKQCIKKEIPLILSSDAHHYKDIIQYFDTTRQNMQNFGAFIPAANKTHPVFQLLKKHESKMH